MSKGMNESAEESVFECFRSPTLFSKSPSVSAKVLTEYDLAAIEHTNNLVSRSSVGLDFANLLHKISEVRPQCLS